MREIAKIINENPGIKLKEVAKRLKLDYPNMYNSYKLARDEGLLDHDPISPKEYQAEGTIREELEIELGKKPLSRMKAWEVLLDRYVQLSFDPRPDRVKIEKLRVEMIRLKEMDL